MISTVVYPSVSILDNASILSITGGSQQAMIYGFGHCGYGALCHKLSQPDSPLKIMLDCSVGNNQQPFYTLDGRKIQQINPEFSSKDTAEANIEICSRMCKAGITNLVLENLKRETEGLTLIPVIFAIDSDDLPVNPANVATREQPLNSFLTNQELRRTYKLCCEIGDEEIRRVALKTFKFIKLQLVNVSEYTCVATTPFWTRRGWSEAWKTRKSTPRSTCPVQVKRTPWNEQLIQAAQAYKREKYQ